jgi:hypothetical protein
MALEAFVDHPEFHRVVLEEYAEGVYVMAFKPGEEWPCRDHLQNDWEMAKRSATQDYGVAEQVWREIPNTRIMG